MQINIPGGGVPGSTMAPVQHTRLDGSGLTATAEAVEGLGKTVFSIAAQEQQRQRQESADLARAKAANALADNDLQTRAITADIAGRVQRGEIPYDKAEEVYQGEVSKFAPPEIPDLDPAMQEHFAGGIRRNSLAGGLTIGNAVKQARRDDGKAQFSTAIDNAGKLAGIPGADIDKINADLEAWRPLARGFGLDDAVITKTIQDRKDANWMNHVSQRAIDSRNDIEETTKLIGDLSREDGYYVDKIDPEKRTAALSVATSNLARLQTNIEVDANKREATGEKALNFYQDNIVTGIPMDPVKVQELYASAKGTAHEADFIAAVQQSAEIQQVKGMPILQQQQYIDQVETALRTTPSSNPKRDKGRVDTLRAALASTQKLAAESPMMLYQYTTGDTVDPIDFGKIMDPETSVIAEGQLGTRYVQLQAMRAKFGPQVSMNPWRPEEASALQLVLSKAENDQAKLMLLGMLSKSAPDAQAYRDTLGPIAQSDRVSYLAGEAQFLNRVSEKGMAIAPVLLHGAKVWENKSVKLPGEAKFLAAFDEDIGDALPIGSTEREDAYIRFKMLYAGMADKVRVREENELDEKLRNTVASLATGGITEYNGKKTVKPYGLKDADFVDKVREQVGNVSVSSGLPAEMLEDMPLMPIPRNEGSYILVSQGRAQLNPKTGRPIIVKVQ